MTAGIGRSSEQSAGIDHQSVLDQSDVGNRGKTPPDAGSLHASEGSSAAAAELVIIRTAALWCGIWILGTVPALSSTESGQVEVWIGYAALAALTLAWFACLVVRFLPPLVLVVAAGLAALIAAANTAPMSLSLPYAAAVPIVNLAVCMIAVLLPGRAGLSAAVALGLMVLAIVLAAAVTSGVIEAAWRGCLLFGAYPIGVGLSAFGTVGALRAVAVADDDATEERLEAVVAEVSERTSRDERFRVARLLHDTVINTFAAIGNGSPLAGTDLIRQRCARDLAVLRTAANPFQATNGDQAAASAATEAEPVVSDVVAAAQRQALLLNVQLTVAADNREITAPRSVVDAVVGALDEALLNTAKHSGANAVELVLSASSDAFHIELSDQGHSRLASTAGMHRKPASITRRCALAGVSADVVSSFGGGTVVRLSWRRNSTPGRENDEDASIANRSVLLKSLPLVARWVTGCFAVIFMVQVIVSWGSGSIAGGLIALVLLASSAGVAIRLGFAKLPIPWPASLLLALAAGLITYAPTAQLSGCDRFGLQYWGSMGGTLCVILIILLLGGTGWVLLGSAAVLIGVASSVAEPSIGPGLQPCTVGSLPSLLATDVALIVAMILFRRLLLHYGERASTSQRSAAATLTRVTTMRQQENARSQQLRSVLASVDTLLAGLATGELNPADPQIQARCRDGEDYLRSLIRIDPDLGPMGQVMAQAVVSAHDRGASLTVRSAEQISQPDAYTLAAIERLLTDVSHRLQQGQPGWLTLLPRSAGASLAVLIPRAARPEAAVLEAFEPSRIAGREGTQLVCIDEGDDVLIEVSWNGPDHLPGPT